jgi:hypothetical protein
MKAPEHILSDESELFKHFKSNDWCLSNGNVKGLLMASPFVIVSFTLNQHLQEQEFLLIDQNSTTVRIFNTISEIVYCSFQWYNTLNVNTGKTLFSIRIK